MAIEALGEVGQRPVSITCIFSPSPTSTLWIGTRKNGLWLLEPTGQIRRIDQEPNTRQNRALLPMTGRMARLARQLKKERLFYPPLCPEGS